MQDSALVSWPLLSFRRSQLLDTQDVAQISIMEIYTSEQSMGVEDRQKWRRIYLLVLSNLLVFMDRDVHFKIYNIRMYGTYASTALTHTHAR